MMKTRLLRSLTSLAIVAAIACASAGLYGTFWSNYVAAQAKKPETPGFFKSGAENVRVAEILNDIATTLKQMDQRVKRIEKLMMDQSEKVAQSN